MCCILTSLLDTCSEAPKCVQWGWGQGGWDCEWTLMYWDYWEEKGRNTPGWETQESGAERWKGQDADEVAARNQSSTDAYTGLGLRTFILAGGEEMTHRRVFKAGAGLSCRREWRQEDPEF